ncbi:hypothetical protein MMPV_009994 [Pyropia vietnamensis]
MAVFLKVVAVSATLVIAVSAAAAAVPVLATPVAEEPETSFALVVPVSAAGATTANLLSMSVGPSRETSDQAAWTMDQPAVRKKTASKKFLTWYYTIAWRLAMHTPDVKKAFQVFVSARRHAAQYVAARPGATPVIVCNSEDVSKQVFSVIVGIMQSALNAKVDLPGPNMYRHMTRAEEKAMHKALAVPLTKPLPNWMLPKAVPILVCTQSVEGCSLLSHIAA